MPRRFRASRKRALRAARRLSAWSPGADLRILVTGVAGFIGYHAARAFLARGDEVVGIDSLDAYYDVALKEARLADLRAARGAFSFRCADIADRDALEGAVGGKSIDIVVHLAAQAGVRASMTDPYAYGAANLVGHLNMLERFRHSDRLVHFIYASSSSIYGANRQLPFSEAERVDDPISLYAATKRADELMSEVYAKLYEMPVTGLRFFTVYGPWGRPDMAVWLFTDAISQGRPVTLYNDGRMRRDFTYIDDAIRAVAAVASGPPANPSRKPHVYNIGNSRAEDLRHLVAIIEASVGRSAEIVSAPIPAGDVPETRADLSWIQADYGYAPEISIDVGVPRFVSWYNDYMRNR